MKVLPLLPLLLVLIAAAEDDEVATAPPEEMAKGEEEEKPRTTGEFKPPDPESMVKFEAEDAVRGGAEEEEEEEKSAATISADLYDSASQLLHQSNAPGSTRQGWDLMRQSAGMGNVDANVKLAFGQMLGRDHFDLDVEAARKGFEEAADSSGHPEAQFALGFLHSTGIAGDSNQAKALLYYTFAAFGGSAFAQMAVGYRYYAGVGVATSCEKALDHYRRVADSVAAKVSFGGGASVQRVRLQDEFEAGFGGGGGSSSSGGGGGGGGGGVLDNDLLEYYQLLADKGDVQAQVGLGQLHFHGGRGVAVDHRLAAGYFTLAADAGNPIAMAFLGKLYLEGSDGVVEASNATAFAFFKKAADLGNPIGQSGVGLMFMEGRGVEKDPKRAAEWFGKAAEQNWVDGLLHLGSMHYRGVGVPQDFRAATKYFNLASQSGHVLAFYNLAEMHATGTGVLRSCPTAVELYKNVAERGRWGETMMEAHADFRKGRLEEAAAKYLLLAEMGYEVAQSNAAFLFDTRQTGTLFDDDDSSWLRALVYWTRAAAQGYSAARVKLGDYYYYGLGTDPNFETAAFHYRIASEQQQNAQAMFNLGYMHELGRGMPQDLHLAKRFYDQAAETTTDAKVPVMLALAKLTVTFVMHKWQVGQRMGDAWEDVVQNWDLYLVLALIALLGILLLARPNPRARRQRGGGGGGHQQPPPGPVAERQND